MDDGPTGPQPVPKRLDPANKPFLWMRDGYYRRGWFDTAGNFVPAVSPRGGRRLGPLPEFVSGFRPARPAEQSPGYPRYEHRSGRLIPGAFNDRGVFVPNLGSTVLDLKTVDPNATFPRLIYNMPETFAAFGAEVRKQFGFKPMPTTEPLPSKPELPFGWDLMLSPVQADNLRPRWHARVVGGVVELGHLGDDGEFDPDYDAPTFKEAGLPDGFKPGGPSDPVYYYTLIGRTSGLTTRFYELRSGRLLYGHLDAADNFIPEIGSTVKNLKDYKPNNDFPIYNLPGEWRKLKLQQ